MTALCFASMRCFQAFAEPEGREGWEGERVDQGSSVGGVWGYSGAERDLKEDLLPPIASIGLSYSNKKLKGTPATLLSHVRALGERRKCTAPKLNGFQVHGWRRN